MKVSTERIPESQVELQIEVDDDRLAKEMASAFRRLAGKTRIPGFRAGKAPRELLERHLGEHAVLHEAIDKLLPQVYQEALEQEELEPVDRADYELVTEEPLVVKFTVPVRPSLELGDYTSLRIARELVVVEPERVEEGLEALRHRYATLEPVSRLTQWGDIVRADVYGAVDGAVLVQEEDAEFQLAEERVISLPGFGDKLIEREKGAEFEFDLTVPEDAPEERLRGSQAHYRVAIKEIKQEVLPELDDEFAQQVGEGFANLEALRARVEEDLRQALEHEEEQRYYDEVLESLVEQTQLDYPAVLVDREVDRLLREQSGAAAPSERAAGSGDGVERYLQLVGKSEEEVRAELRPVAEARVRRSLVLSEVVEAEHILVTDAEVEAEISRVASGAGGHADEMRRLFSNESAKESLRRSLVTKRALGRLAEIASAQDEPQADAVRNEE